MPCWMRGELRLTDFEKLQAEANKLGLELLKQSPEIITILKNGVAVATATEAEITKGANQYFKETVKNYTIQQVKVAAMRNGWKFEQVKVEDGKIKLRVSE